MSDVVDRLLPAPSDAINKGLHISDPLAEGDLIDFGDIPETINALLQQGVSCSSASAKCGPSRPEKPPLLLRPPRL